MTHSSTLSEAQRAQIAAQVDYFIEVVGKRYQVNPDEIVDAVRWVREKKAVADKVKSSGLLALVGLIVTSLAIAVWEGIKALAKGAHS